jgi:cytochrome c oxidase subunit 2
VTGVAQGRSRPVKWRWRATALVAPLLLLLASCAKKAPQDTLKPKGAVARKIDHLIDPVFIIAGVVFLLVEFLSVYLVWKYRHRDDAPEPVQIHGNTRLELAWTLIPAFILLAIAVPTIRTIFDLSRVPKNAVNVTVIGHQFWWEIRYDDFGISTANELHMPTGRPVEITLKGDPNDVIHSFWIPPLAGKTDVIPGRTNHMHFEADKPGTYQGQCTEYCGLSHANMRARAVAHSPEEFDVWVQNQKQAPRTPSPGTPAAEGEALFTAKGCAGCHSIQGISQGAVGPNLTHLGSRSVFAGAMFDLNSGNLSRWLRDPPAVKPGSKMPNLNLSPDEIAKLVAYLESLQ